ncbi:hypothetical protein JCM19240_3461 [Vibrio maritimus]|uniref:Uncharacterized protein n=1 Tax=Vibrio maritimus TaxID=990268 RepID=A0A090T594_9VIBR|nr:hypothetical protein JCM19240_3461 [Vibrio maritimus]
MEFVYSAAQPHPPASLAYSLVCCHFASHAHAWFAFVEM